jgi:polysaccharide deacetylase 2 family uncharacterized protein YibQ
MRRSDILMAVSALFVIAAALIYWKVSHPAIVDKTAELNEGLKAVFSKYGLGYKNQVRKVVEEKKAGMGRHVWMYLEYDVPAAFPLKNFEADLKGSLGPTPFRVAKTDQMAAQKYDINIFVMRFKMLDVLTLRINKKRAAEMLPMVRRFENPKVAIVIDDFGYNMNNVDTFLGMNKPLTFSVLPNLKYSAKVAEMAREKGNDVMLHLALEPKRDDLKPEPGEINSRMGEAEVLARLDAAMKSVPGIKGVSNHEGSKSTEEAALMTVIMNDLKRRGLFFFDSLTSQNSICQNLAGKSGIRFAKRDIFLDNESDVNSVKRNLAGLAKFAFGNGRAIAICHDRKNTAAALAETMPLMAREGIEFVRLSELVK